MYPFNGNIMVFKKQFYIFGKENFIFVNYFKKTKRISSTPDRSHYSC